MDGIDSNKPYDLTAIKALCDINLPFMEKLLVVFYDNIHSDLQLLLEAAKAGNWNEVGQLAHKMKSSLAHFGVSSLKDTIQGLEHYGNSDQQKLNLLVINFEKVVNSVLAHLELEFPAVFNK